MKTCVSRYPALLAGLLTAAATCLANAVERADEVAGGRIEALTEEGGRVRAVAPTEAGAEPTHAVAHFNASPIDFTASVLEDGGYFELGLAVAASSTNRVSIDPDENGDVRGFLSPFFAGAWRKGAYFIEGKRGGFDGLSLGATLWHDEQWVLDLLAVHGAGTYSFRFDDDDRPAGTTRRDEELLERLSVFASTGLRLRRYAESSLLQVSAVADWENGHGTLLGAHIGRQWQIGNWNTQFLVGARHASSALADFAWGVDEDEATERFGAHRMSGIAFAEMELGISRAVGKKWILSSRLSGRRFEDSLVESPLITQSGFATLDTAVSYVF